MSICFIQSSAISKKPIWIERDWNHCTAHWLSERRITEPFIYNRKLCLKIIELNSEWRKYLIFHSLCNLKNDSHRLVRYSFKMIAFFIFTFLLLNILSMLVLWGNATQCNARQGLNFKSNLNLRRAPHAQRQLTHTKIVKPFDRNPRSQFFFGFNFLYFDILYVYQLIGSLEVNLTQTSEYIGNVNVYHDQPASHSLYCIVM